MREFEAKDMIEPSRDDEDEVTTYIWARAAEERRKRTKVRVEVPQQSGGARQYVRAVGGRAGQHRFEQHG